MSIKAIDQFLYHIALPQIEPGFNNFISTWVYKEKNFCLLVDPGPTSTINLLLEKLTSLGIMKGDLNYILLTHIHMDHAGGAGKLLSFFPDARVICHPRGIKHLIHPEKLWEATKKTLGTVANMYGKIIPIPEEKILFQEFIEDQKIKAIETLGHAPYHLAFLLKQYLFIGDAAGVYFPLPNNLYIRPTTPPIFDYDLAISSLDKLISLNLSDYMICYAHFGLRENADKMLRIAKKQLSVWKQVIERLFKTRTRPDFETTVIEKLREEDNYFANIDLFDDDVRKRELTFIGNNIKGITKFIEKKKSQEQI